MVFGRKGCDEKSDWEVTIFYNDGYLRVCEQLFLEQAKKIYKEVVTEFKKPARTMEIEDDNGGKRLINKRNVDCIYLKRE